MTAHIYDPSGSEFCVWCEVGVFSLSWMSVLSPKQCQWQLSISDDCLCIGLCLDSLLSYWSIYLSLPHTYNYSSYKLNLDIWYCKSPNFILKGYFYSSWPFAFPFNFRISLPVFTHTKNRLLIEITLNAINLGRIHILQYCTFREHSICLHFLRAPFNLISVKFCGFLCGGLTHLSLAFFW